ncbi:MAG: AMP-binding protein [Saprospiraceae bacterium]|nr:MAG: long-chain-fatty-acid--CoA ligase [Candidatus Parvibacillus calidus]MCC7148851.1 AMP-binding protein [Saprospiraceae bacterium]WKZ63520.1 MAG: AMP-binding protein [Saprospiraceae bacterium]
MHEKIWLKHYPSNIPTEVRYDEYPNLNSFIRATIREYGDQVAFISMDKKLTYNQLDKYADQFAAYLASLGMKPGDKLALMMPNILQYPIALFAAIRAGYIVVNTNPLYTPREMKLQFQDAGVTAIVIAENFAYNLQQIIGETKIKHVITASIGEMLGGLKGPLVNFVIRKVKKMVPAYNLPGSVSFKKALGEGISKPVPHHDSRSEDTVIFQYTGGTTGIAKGAMLTNENLLANLEQVKAIFLSQLRKNEEVGFCALPLYHIFAFTVNCLVLFSLGCPNVLIVNPKDIPSLIKEWKKNSPSIFPAVNTLFNALANNDQFRQLDFSNLKIPIAGGMALQSTVAENWKKVTGVRIVEGYGLTETSPVASVNPLDGREKIGTIGWPVPSTDMRIVNDEGVEVAQGETGEIQIKGPQVMKGYYNKPEETNKVLKDGWFSTGDVGLMEADGYFRIVDRKKDMILVSGFNVYPNEIEEVAVSFPKVLEAAAVGVPDEKSGEHVKLFVVKKDSSLTAEELLEYMKKNLTQYKHPKEIEFRDDLPKTNVGKILRRELRN